MKTQICIASVLRGRFCMILSGSGLWFPIVKDGALWFIVEMLVLKSKFRLW